MAYKSAYKAMHAALRTALARTGVHTGGTAAYPRVELHSFVEAESGDKLGMVRVLTCVCESISTVSPDAAYTMNADNLAVFSSFTYSDTDFRLIGIVPRNMQDLQETADAQTAYYRILQTIDIVVEQIS